MPWKSVVYWTDWQRAPCHAQALHPEPLPEWHKSSQLRNSAQVFHQSLQQEYVWHIVFYSKVVMAKKAGLNWKCYEITLTKSFETSPPHDIAVPLPQNSFLASLWIGSGLGWPERDFGVMGGLYHVGARFEALDESVLTVPWIFFRLEIVFFMVKNKWREMCTKNPA